MRRSLAVAGAIAAVLAAPASAHVEIRPPFAPSGEAVTVALDSPNEREHMMTALEVVAPAGVEILRAEAPTGWRAAPTGRRVMWSGGRLAPRATAVFGLRLRVSRDPGPLSFRAFQRFSDGATVVWRPSLTIVPGSRNDEPQQHLGRALVAALAGLAVIAASLLTLHRLRRRRASAPY